MNYYIIPLIRMNLLWFMIHEETRLFWFKLIRCVMTWLALKYFSRIFSCIWESYEL